MKTLILLFSILAFNFQCYGYLNSSQGSSYLFGSNEGYFNWIGMPGNSADDLEEILNKKESKISLAKIASVKVSDFDGIEIRSEKRNDFFEELFVKVRFSNHPFDAFNMENLVLCYCRIRRLGFTDRFAWECLKVQSELKAHEDLPSWQKIVIEKIPVPLSRLQEKTGIYRAVYGAPLGTSKREIYIYDTHVSVMVILDEVTNQVFNVFLVDSRLVENQKTVSILQDSYDLAYTNIEHKYGKEGITKLELNNELRSTIDREINVILGGKKIKALLLPSTLPQISKFW